MKIFKEPSIRQITVSVSIILMFSVISIQSQAQQNPYPFTVDLNFGGGLIGDSNTNTAFQPELGFSYMRGRFGVGLNAGLLSYDPSFDAQQYAAGFEDYTSVSGSDEKWSSFFLSLGPRFEFGSSLPVTFRSSLDLSLSYNSPPSMSVDFNDPDGSAGDLQLQLSGYEAGDDYRKWSAAIRPEFQMQFSPGGSDRFAITVATGIQHRLSQNEFTYSQRDLSEVRVVPNSQEMFMQFEMAPEVQQSAQPPKTNFFTTVGIKIKFGSPKRMSAPGQDYNATRSNKPGSIADGVGDGDLDSDDDGIDDGTETVNDGSGAGDCDDSDSDRCIKPGERSSNDADSNADGIDDPIETAQDHRSTKALKKGDRLSTEISDDIWDDCDDDGSCPHPDELLHKAKELELASAGNDIQNIKEVLDRCGDEVCGQVRLNADKRHEGVRRALENPSTIDSEIEEIQSIVREDVESLGKCETDVCREVLAMEQQLLMKMNRLSDIAKVAPAQDYNSSRSNKPNTIADGVGDGDADSDGDGIDDAIETGQDYNASRSNKPRSEISDDIWDDCDDDGSCPHPDELLHKAKELELASAGNDIQNIKEVLDRCGEEVCLQVRQHADERHHGVARAQENPTEIDTHIEEIRSIVREDVESLGKCETDVCRETLAMEVQLLVKMNRLSDLAQIAPGQDYNSSRSNKPDESDVISFDNISFDGNHTYSCHPGSDEVNAIGPGATYEEYSQFEEECKSLGGVVRGPIFLYVQGEARLDINGDVDSDDDGIDDGVAKAISMARLIHPPNVIIAAGAVAMVGNPLYKGNNHEGENPMYEGQANDGDTNHEENKDSRAPSPVQKYELQPSSFCMELSTMKVSTNSQKSMRAGDQGSGSTRIATATDYNSSRSNTTSSIDLGDLGSDGFPDVMKNASLKVNQKVKPGKMKTGDVTLKADTGDMDGDGYGDAAGFQFDLEIDPIDPDDDGDGLSDALESATYSISKRSARTGRNSASGRKEIETMESKHGVARNQTSNIYEWTYNLSALSDTGDLDGDGHTDLMKNATLTLLFTEGKMHVDLQIDPIDPDDDGDGYGDLLQNSSFSISKRSARTGRN